MAAMATSATGSMFGRYTSMLPIPDVRQSGRRAHCEHDQDRVDENDAGRHADQSRHPRLMLQTTCRKAAVRDEIATAERAAKTIKEKLDRLDEAFLFERSIDIETFDRHAEKLREELTLARNDHHSGQLEELDVEGILAFAERILPRAAELWVQASLEQRQRFQQLFFPDGIAFDGNRFCWNRRNRTGLQLLAGD